ncbi:MAG: crotonase/enoyl-CoA hydratase family protein [Ferroplasma sp.]|uniref:crotonase/enoyl-CoA hydratase family protein n=1 Tax=Ferroplasma sp. TaxID=2591003 RepID=UPI0028155317|nr:crotonase/enoyl-CoA hydratase family protein [Ferroplasma sp.]WMT50907.1 MAG: crotonase/enoyl-CoA hydratase family protein [Ferroplasma sp.]
MDEVLITRKDRITIITINRPDVRNAVNYKTSKMLENAMLEFNSDSIQHIAIITGTGGNFSAGADLSDAEKMGGEVLNKNGPMGFSRMDFQKPVIAAVEGYCVAGGLEMALAADIRVAGKNAKLGFLERRFGVPLIDGGTQRLPRIIGMGRALDLILTGKIISADEAHRIGLINYLAEGGKALEKAVEIAMLIDSFPWTTVVNDRLALIQGISGTLDDGLRVEAEFGKKTIESGVVKEGAERFLSGSGRHGNRK